MEIHINVPYRDIQQQLVEAGENVVKRIYQARKDACLMAAGDVLQENGYLPNGTTYEAWNDKLYFSVDKGTNADLAHYFHEGMIYGPNIPIFEKDAEGNRTGKILRFFSPKGKPKTAIYPMRTQGVGKPAGVAHWTKAVEKGGPLYEELEQRITEILERR